MSHIRSFNVSMESDAYSNFCLKHIKEIIAAVLRIEVKSGLASQGRNYESCKDKAFNHVKDYFPFRYPYGAPPLSQDEQ